MATKKRICRDCPADISDRGKRAVRCKTCAEARIAEKNRRANQRYMQRKRLEEAGGRICSQCREADISHRTRSRNICEACAKKNSQHRTDERIAMEICQLYDMAPKRWPAEVLAERYEYPLEQVQHWIATREDRARTLPSGH